MTSTHRQEALQDTANGYKRYKHTPCDQDCYRCNACNASTEGPQAVGGRLMYRAEEAAFLLNISRTRIFELLRSNQLDSVTYGRTRLITHRALLEFVSELEASA